MSGQYPDLDRQVIDSFHSIANLVAVSVNDEGFPDIAHPQVVAYLEKLSTTDMTQTMIHFISCLTMYMHAMSLLAGATCRPVPELMMDIDLDVFIRSL